MSWVKKLDNALLREGISPAVAFKHADADHDGAVSKKELGDAIKRLVPDDAISLMDLLKVL
jgi:Ca2+-binding EF-hand superfamily protein